MTYLWMNIYDDKIYKSPWSMCPSFLAWDLCDMCGEDGGPGKEAKSFIPIFMPKDIHENQNLKWAYNYIALNMEIKTRKNNLRVGCPNIRQLRM